MFGGWSSGVHDDGQNWRGNEQAGKSQVQKTAATSLGIASAKNNFS
jgi:hypothetical protein